MDVSQIKEINIKLLRTGRKRSNVSNNESGYHKSFLRDLQVSKLLDRNSEIGKRMISILSFEKQYCKL